MPPRKPMTASERRRRAGKAAEGTSGDMNVGTDEERHSEAEDQFRIVLRGSSVQRPEAEEQHDEEEDEEQQNEEEGDEEEGDEEALNEKGGPRNNDVIREFDTHVASMIWLDQVRGYYLY